MSSILTISKRYKQILFLGLVSFLLFSCSGKLEEGVIIKTTSSEFSAPVTRDFDQIRENGVLRVITRYSSRSYFLDHGIQAGFEYEFIQAFAKLHGLSVEIVIPVPGQSPIQLLNDGKGDIIADNLIINEESSEWVHFSRSYDKVNQVAVVSSDLGYTPYQVNELEGIPITISKNSIHFSVLNRLMDAGWKLEINVIEEERSTESLLMDLARGEILATVADDQILQASKKYMRGLVEGPVLARNDEVAWAVRSNAPILKNQVNTFLSQHMWVDEDGTPKRSEFLNVLRKKYFEGSRQVADYFNPIGDQQTIGALSPYDSLMQQVAVEFGLDWVMLTAIAAQESKFDPTVVSWAGAVGIMQVIPKYSELTADSLLIPEINIREGARILSKHIQHYSYMDSLESWSFALATYNAGAGHLADARRITMDHNKDPNKWVNVSQSLLKKMEPKYYEFTRYGYARGIETVQYVQNILNRYNTYKAIIVLSQESRSETKDILGFSNLKISG
tara:strand:- start:9175 stop:10686 length:1512 start_codon:yes stop_codon:yes gene_type:complete